MLESNIYFLYYEKISPSQFYRADLYFKDNKNGNMLSSNLI